MDIMTPEEFLNELESWRLELDVNELSVRSITHEDGTSETVFKLPNN